MQLKWYRKEQNIQCRVVASNWNDLMVIFLNTLITLHGMLDINSKLDYSGRRANLILDSISIVSLMNDSVVFWHVWHLRAMLMNHQVNPWEQINANKETTQTGMQTDKQTDDQEALGSTCCLSGCGCVIFAHCWCQSLAAVAALMFSGMRKHLLSPLLVG